MNNTTKERLGQADPMTDQHETRPAEIHEQAQEGALAEHDLTLMQALRRYPKACIWSVLVSMSIIMEGYDNTLIYSLYAQPAFSKKYGVYSPNNDSYTITANWQLALGNGTQVGTIIGAFANGYFTHKFGYRKVLLASLVAIAGFIFIPFFAPSVQVLLAGQILCGIPWGVFATTAPAYASEVCPLALRGYLTVYVNLCWAFGQLIAAGVLEGFSEGTSKWAYRVPFAIQWAWPIPLFIILYFTPESPWYLVRIGNLKAATKSIRRLTSASDTDVQRSLAHMIHTNELEKHIDDGTKYVDCFKGIDLRRTEIVCMAFMTQPFCGSAIGGTPTYFFVQAGLSSSISFQMTLGGLGLASVGTIISWKLMHSFGRRTLYIAGLVGLTTILLTVGSVSAGAGDTRGGQFAQAGLMLVWNFWYYLTIGPICYAVISETSSTRLRNKSVCLSRIAYYIASILANIVNPYMINPTAGNWKGKTAFFWAGSASLFLLWTYFRLPETKDRTYEELDLLFNQKVHARDFKKFHVDPYVSGGIQTVTKPEALHEQN